MISTLFLSRWEFAKAVPSLTDEHAVISLNDTTAEMAESTRLLTPKDCNFIVMQVKDDEKDFTKAQAEYIVKFVKKHKDKQFVVHCFAGLSRSAAVALWIEEYLVTLGAKTQVSPLLRGYKVYNRHIYNMLNNASVAQ